MGGWTASYLTLVLAREFGSCLRHVIDISHLARSNVLLVCIILQRWEVCEDFGDGWWRGRAVLSGGWRTAFIVELRLAVSAVLRIFLVVSIDFVSCTW